MFDPAFIDLFSERYTDDLSFYHSSPPGLFRRGKLALRRCYVVKVINDCPAIKQYFIVVENQRRNFPHRIDFEHCVKIAKDRQNTPFKRETVMVMGNSYSSYEWGIELSNEYHVFL